MKHLLFKSPKTFQEVFQIFYNLENNHQKSKQQLHTSFGHVTTILVFNWIIVFISKCGNAWQLTYKNACIVSWENNADVKTDKKY